MPKPRRATRVMIAALVCLAAGAVLSVGVALGFGLWGTVRTDYDNGLAVLTDGRMTPVDGNQAGFAAIDLSTCRSILEVLPRSGILGQASDRGMGTTDIVVAVCTDDGCPAVLIHRTGWPVRSLEYRTAGDMNFLLDSSGRSGWRLSDWGGSFAGQGGWRAPYWLMRADYSNGWGSPGERHPVPLRPIPFGLAVDAAFFGGILFATYAVVAPGRRALRGMLRHRIGRCPACGYSRAGLAAGAACPECGR